MPPLLGPALLPSPPSQNHNFYNNLSLPFTFGIYSFNKRLLHTYFGLEDTELKEMSFVLKETQPTLTNS